MSTRRIATLNTTALTIIGIMAIIVAFLLLGGGSWLKGMMHGNSLRGFANLNWMQILISLGLGFLLGLAVSRKK